MRTFDTPGVLGVLSTHQVFWGCSEHTPGVLGTGAEQGMHGRTEHGHGDAGCSGGVLGVLAVFWMLWRCSGGVLDILDVLEVFWAHVQVFWRCSGRAAGCSGHTHGCSGGVLDSRRTWEIGHQRDKPRGVRILYV